MDWLQYRDDHRAISTLICRYEYNEALARLASLALDSEWACRKRLECLRQLKRFDEWQLHFGGLPGSIQSSASIQIERGWYRMDSQQWQSALDIFSTVRSAQIPISNLEAADLYDRASEGVLQAYREKRDEVAFLRELASAKAECNRFPINRILREEGWYRFDQGDIPSALKAFTAITDQAEVDREGIIACHRSLHNSDKAQELLNRWLDEFPRSARLLNEQGWLHLYQREYDCAFDCFTRAQNVRNPVVDAVSLQGKLATLRLQRRLDEAESLFQDYEKLSQERPSPRVLNERGWQLLDSWRYVDAGKIFARARHLSPGDESACLGTVRALRLRRRLTDALKALDQYQSQRTPTRLGLINERALLYIDLGRFEEAELLFQRCLAINPRFSFAIQGTIRLLTMTKAFDSALRSADRAIADFPGDPVFIAEKGTCLFFKGDFERSYRCFEEAHSLAPSWLTLLGWRVELLCRLERFETAGDLLALCSKKHPGELRVKYELGRLYLRTGETTKARELFRSASGYPPALNGLLYIELSAKQIGSPRAHMLAPGTLEEGDPDSVLGRSMIDIVECGGSAAGEWIHSGVLAHDPRNPTAYCYLGWLALGRNEFSSAESHFKRAVEYSHGEQGLVELGKLYTDWRALEDARTTLDLARQRNPVDGRIQFEIGRVQLLLSDFRGALAFFHRALRLHCDAEMGGLAVSVCLIELGDLGAAETHLRSLAKDSQNRIRGEVLYLLSRLLFRLGNERERKNILSEALSQAECASTYLSSDGRVLFQRGLILLRMGRRAEAIRALRQVAATNDDYWEAQRLLASQESLNSRLQEAAGPILVGGACIQLFGAVLCWLYSPKLETIPFVSLVFLSWLLIASGLAFPALVRLKFPGGLEAEMKREQDSVSLGPDSLPTLLPNISTASTTLAIESSNTYRWSA